MIEISGDAIEILLEEGALRTNQLITCLPAGSNQHDQDAIVGDQQEAQMLDHAACQRRRNKNAQAARNGGEDVAGALHDRLRSLGGFQLAANPLAVFRAGSSLRRDLLHKESICRGGWHAPGGSLGLVIISAFLQLDQHVADCG